MIKILKKSKPTSGMDVVWINQNDSVNSSHCEELISKYGISGIKVVTAEALSLDPNSDNYFVTLSKNGETILSPVFGVPMFFDWYWLKPVKQK
jgi:hypothetical protein